MATIITEGQGQKRGVAINGHDILITGCYISECWAIGADSQAICGWNGTGGFTITNNYLEAAGENFMCGGSDPVIPNLVPMNLTFTRNLCDKPVAWRGSTKQVKNIFELKNFDGAVIRGNRFFHCWSAAQPGYPILFTPVNQDGTNNSTVVQNILFEYNWVGNVPGGVSITGHDAQATSRTSQRTNNITIRHNLFNNVGTNWGNSLRAFSLDKGVLSPLEGPSNVTIDHNTIIAQSANNLNSCIYFAAKTTSGYTQMPGFVYKNNLHRKDFYGVFGDSSLGEGLPTLTSYAPGYVFLQNVIAGANSSIYPTSNFFPTETTFISSTFVDYANGDYHLDAASPYNNAGTDGLDIGADIDSINAAYFGTSIPPTCSYAVAPTSVPVAASTTTGSLTVTSQVGCAWTAVSNVGWITINSGASGSGNGTVSYTVAANTGALRVGTMTVAGSTVTVTQAAAPPPPCTYSVSPTTVAVASTASSGTITVTTQTGCGWTAVANDSFLSITAGTSGSGSGTVTYAVAANTVESPRSGTLTVGGVTITINQAAAPAPCTYSVSPLSRSVAASGATGLTATVTTAGGCGPWTGVSNNGFITVTAGSSVTGPGSTTYSVAANTSSSARTGTLTVAGATVTVTQAGLACTYSTSLSTATVAAAGETRAATITSVTGCAWTATSQAAWITLSAGSGTGSGSTNVIVAANATFVSRTGTVVIAGTTFTITQDAATAPCSYVVSPLSQVVGASGSTGFTATVTTQDACTWTAVSNDSWITVTGGASGTANGTVTYTVAANASTSARTGSITIAGETLSVSQDGAVCTYVSTISSTTNVNRAGGTRTVTITSQTGCAWTAVSNVSWITPSVGSGTGSGTVTLTVAANTGALRTGTVVVAGSTFTVTQTAACTYSVTPTSRNVVAAGATGLTATITSQSGCAWTGVSNDGWITVTGGASGTASGTCTYTVDANSSSSSRTGTLTVAGITVTITQAGLTCTYSTTLSSTAIVVYTGATITATVTAVTGCAWTATSLAGWITPTPGSGSGNGSVSLVVDANADEVQRSGTVVIAGTTFEIVQAPAPGVSCSYVISPTAVEVNSLGKTQAVTITTQGGCTWTAVANDSWLHVSAGGGTGSGSVTVTIDAGAGPRTGTVTIAGETFTVTQDAACTYAVDVTDVVVDYLGDTGLTINVTSATGCGWVAVESESWITLTAGSSGEGNGTVTFDVSENTGTARVGTITVAGYTVHVAQAAITEPVFCTYSVAPTQVIVKRAGGSSTIAVTTQSGCSWTAVSSVGFITITGGSSGTGNGTVSYTVAANPGASRGGTITIAGLVVTIGQKSRGVFSWATCTIT